MSGAGPLVLKVLPVSDEMAVTLRSKEAGAFTVVPPDSDIKGAVRGLQPGGHAEWHRTVTPNAVGERHMILHSVFLDNSHGGAPLDQGNWEVAITVQVIPWYQAAGSFLGHAIRTSWPDILKWFLPSSGLVDIASISGWRRKRRTHQGQGLSKKSSGP